MGRFFYVAAIRPQTINRLLLIGSDLRFALAGARDPGQCFARSLQSREPTVAIAASLILCQPVSRLKSALQLHRASCRDQLYWNWDIALSWSAVRLMTAWSGYHCSLALRTGRVVVAAPVVTWVVVSVVLVEAVDAGALDAVFASTGWSTNLS